MRALGCALAIGVAVAGPVMAVPAGAARLDASLPCKPGSGKDLAGKQITTDEITTQSVLQCADLQGAHMGGLSLGQADLTGSNLRGADLSNADLTQATLTGVDLTGANLSGADLTQATLTDATLVGANLEHAKLGQTTDTGANFTKANLAHVDFTQAHLDEAKLTDATVTGTSFTQAYLSGTDFTGVKGVFPYETAILGAAGLVFLFMLVTSLKPSSLRNRGVGRIVISVIGGFVIAAGVHLFLGGLVDEMIGSFGTPVTQTCHGPTCSVGVSSGFVGLFVGVFVVIAGGMIRGASGGRRMRSQQQFDISSMMAPPPSPW